MSDPRRFKLVEDPEGDLTEDYLRTMIHHDCIPPAPEPQYPEWTDEFSERVEQDIVEHDGLPRADEGRIYLRSLYDDGLLVVEREEWERLTAEEQNCPDGVGEPAPSYSDEEVERSVERHWDGIKPGAISWSDLSPTVRTAYVDFAKDVLSAARPDPAKWVSREKHDRVRAWLDGALENRDQWRASTERAEAALRTKHPDLRPTEEQVREALRERGWWNDSIDAHILRARKDGWLRDTEAPPLNERQADEGFCCRTGCCGPGSWCCQHANKGHACDGDTERIRNVCEDCGHEDPPLTEAPNQTVGEMYQADREVMAKLSPSWPLPPRKTPVVHRLPSIADGTVEGRLADSLRDLGDSYGPRGVARAAAEMAGATLKTPEEQAVLDAADELVDWWHRGSTAVFTRTERCLVDAVRAYRATKTQEGEG